MLNIYTDKYGRQRAEGVINIKENSVGPNGFVYSVLEIQKIIKNIQSCIGSPLPIATIDGPSHIFKNINLIVGERISVELEYEIMINHAGDVLKKFIVENGEDNLIVTEDGILAIDPSRPVSKQISPEDLMRSYNLSDLDINKYVESIICKPEVE